MAQGDCIQAASGIYGSPNVNERGKCLLPTADHNGLYVIGMVEDSVLIMKTDLNGLVIWAWTFDIVPGKVDHVSAAILDSEGMIAVTGIAGGLTDGGTTYIFRYNPLSHQLLWAREYVSAWARNYAFAIKQKGIGGNYVVCNNPHVMAGASTNDDERLHINKNTGDIISGLSLNIHYGGSNNTSDLEYYDGHFYSIGRYTEGVATSSMRNCLIKVDPDNNLIVWIKLGHVHVNQPARLYGKDLVIVDDFIYSLYYGDPVGSSTTNTKVFMKKVDLNGNLTWTKQYDLPGNNDIAHQIITAAGGLVVLCMRNLPPKQIILYKVNYDGDIIWGKTIELPSFISSVEIDRGNEQLIEVGSSMFITATGVRTNGTTDLLLIKTDLDGDAESPCIGTVSLGIPVQTILPSAFFTIVPTVTTMALVEILQFPEGNSYSLAPAEECTIMDTIYTQIDTTICEGGSYGGYSLGGIYEDLFIASTGCDSIRTLFLTIQELSSTLEQVQIRTGEIYNGHTLPGVYTDTLPGATGCDSVHTLILDVIAEEILVFVEICDGQAYEGYTIPGVYMDILPGVAGECDTIRHLELTVWPVFEEIISISICEGESYEGYMTSGVYEDRYTTKHGCDSLRIVHLDVWPAIESAEAIEICPGALYEGYSEPGVYTDYFTGSNGCDSIRILTLGLSDTIETFVQALVCVGMAYEGYFEPGMYSDTFISASGCDSIRWLSLFVDTVVWGHESITICPGQNFNGYTEEGTYMDTLISVTGCDSIHTLVLTVTELAISVSVSICEGDTYAGYSLAGDYIDILPGSGTACDTTRYLSLAVWPIQHQVIEAVICEGGVYEGYTQAGQYTDYFTSLSGCDSIRTLWLTVTDTIETFVSVEICPGQEYDGYADAGQYTDVFTSAFGCDSIRYLELAVQLPERTLNISICAGDLFEMYDHPGFYVDTLPGPQGGCDTIRLLTLEVVPLPVLTSVHTICEGSHIWGYTLPGTYIDTLHNAGTGCDTLRILTLDVQPVFEVRHDETICSGQSYNGYSFPGTYTDTLISALGCDSLVFLDLDFAPPVFSRIEASYCDAHLYGVSAPRIYTDTFQTPDGCDSLRIVHVTDGGLYIPNAFTPNDDGINDVFGIYPFPAESITLEYFAIFDRLGNMAYETRTDPVSWKGDDPRGKPYQPGVYAYLLVYHCGKNRLTMYGNVSLIK